MGLWDVQQRTAFTDTGLFSVVSPAPARDAKTGEGLLALCERADAVLDLEVNHYRLFDKRDEFSAHKFSEYEVLPPAQGTPFPRMHNYPQAPTGEAGLEEWDEEWGDEDVYDDEFYDLDDEEFDGFDYLRIAQLQPVSRSCLEEYVDCAHDAGSTVFESSVPALCYGDPSFEAFDAVANYHELSGGLDVGAAGRVLRSSAWRDVLSFTPERVFRSRVQLAGSVLHGAYLDGLPADEVVSGLVDVVCRVPLEVHESLKILQRFVPGDLVSYEQEFKQARLGVASEMYGYAQTAREDIARSLLPVLDELRRNQYV